MFKGVSAPWGQVARRAVAYIIPALVFVACSGDDPQVPTTLVAPVTQNVTGIAGQAASPVPSVTLKDQKGRGVANVWVKWTTGAGKATNDSSQTDANGTATVGNWTLGTTAGPQTLTATASQLTPVVFSATVAAGPVSALNVITTAPSGVVGTDVTTLPSVRAVDQYGNSVANVAVTFTVTSGGGTITSPQQVTNTNGIATVGSWKLGTIAGVQTLRATASTGITTVISANALGAAPVELVAFEGTSPTGSPNKRLCTSPRVFVRDVYGNGVASVPVSFTPAAGSGSVDVSTVVTSSTGAASVNAWNLGATGTQTITATTPALPGKQVTITVTLVPAPAYNICARFIGDGGTARQRLAIARAVTRWQSVITSHVQTTRLNAPAQQCYPTLPAVNEDVEDLLLFVELTDIDGPNGTIAESGPCYVHPTSFLTLMGILRFDVADLEVMQADGRIDNVMLHELGHIIGIGTLWGQVTSTFARSLLSGGGGPDPFFVGASTRDQFALLFSGYSGTPVPVENCIALDGTKIPGCGGGTRDAHWRKSVFNNELMQGYVAPVMPMSKVTIASLADLGYIVNLNAADPFTLGSSLRSLESTAQSPGTSLGNDVMDLPLWSMEPTGVPRLLRTPINPLKRY